MTILNDGIQSLATSLGQRSAAREFVGSRRLSDRKLEDLYANSWIIQKYIDGGVSDMTRMNREISTPMDTAQTKALESAYRRLGAFAAREEVLTWASLFGDAMVMAVTDNDNTEQPLDIDNEKIVRFIVLDKTAYDFDKTREDDITSANFGKPRMYRVNVGSQDFLVHNSRVVRIEAGKRSIKSKNGTQGKYGRSDVQGIYQPLINYLATATNISDIVDQSKVDVLSIEGFNRGIASGRESDFEAVAIAMRSIQSSTDALLLDSTTTYDRKEMTFAGLVEILKAQRDDLAGACNRPLTRLFGQSASGFASGAEDNQNYYETIASLQESRLRPVDEFIDKFVLREIGFSQTYLEFTYPSIELSNETENAAILSTTVSALSTALQDGVIDEAQYATELRNKGLVTSITDESIKELKDLISESQDTTSEAEQASRSLLSQANEPANPNYAGNSSFGA